MIELRYTSTLADYRAVNHYVILKKLRKSIFLFGALFAVSLSAALLNLAATRRMPTAPAAQSPRNPLSLFVLPGGILALFGLTAFQTQRAIRARWSQAEELREEKKFSFDEAGLRVEGKSFQGFMEWSHFAEVEFWRGFVFLRTGQGQFHYFPLAGASDRAGLMALLKSKLKVR